MTIRSRLLLLLLPSLLAFLLLISLFFYFDLSSEIINGFMSRLQSIVITTSQMIPPDEIDWLVQHIHDPGITANPTYLQYRKQLEALKEKLPIENIYIVQIEPAPKESYLISQETQSLHNQITDRDRSLNTHRQLMLLDIGDSSQGGELKPGEYDFSERDEQLIYLTKKPMVTPIYESRKSHERLLSAFSPILDKEGKVIALLGANVSMKEIDHKLHKALLILMLGFFITLLLITITVFVIADRISQPVRQLNQAAMGIAAGDYEANIEVKGPKEIVELAHTLNTMSECLVEHMSRLRESSLIRERMYGEYECALLLQHYMLQKVIEEFHHSSLNIVLISVPLSPLQKGLFLKICCTAAGDASLTLLEASEPGFAALVQLNQWAHISDEELKDKDFVECCLTEDNKRLNWKAHTLFPPLVWSIKSQQFIKGALQQIPLQTGDMIFLYNSSLIEQFETEPAIETWFSRVLRHFSDDGLDTIQTMLTNELTFLAKKQPVKYNYKIIALQLKHHEPLI